jgi:hypothetical protein
MHFRSALQMAPLLAVMFGARADAQTSSIRPRADTRASTSEQRRPVVLQTQACADLAQAELHELIALELAPRRVIAEAAVDQRDAAVSATLICDEREARVSLHTSDQRKHHVQLDFAEIQLAARPRLVALALSELLATAEMEQTPTVLEPTEAPAPKPQAKARVPARRSLWLAGGLAREGRPALLLPLGELGFHWHLGALPLAFDARLFGGAGERALRLGRTQAWSVGGALSIAYAPRLGPLLLGVGAGVTLGYAQLRGRAAESRLGRRVSGSFWGPALLLSAVLTLRERWGLRAGIDLAYLLRGVEGSDEQGRTLFTYAGLQLHATLGVVVSF